MSLKNQNIHPVSCKFFFLENKALFEYGSTGVVVHPVILEFDFRFCFLLFLSGTPCNDSGCALGKIKKGARIGSQN